MGFSTRHLRVIATLKPFHLLSYPFLPILQLAVYSSSICYIRMLESVLEFCNSNSEESEKEGTI